MQSKVKEKEKVVFFTRTGEKHAHTGVLNANTGTVFLILVFLFSFSLIGQIDSLTNEQKDSIYIFEIQDKYEKDKVLHAEPLYIDLIRDLGARKGERE